MEPLESEIQRKISSSSIYLSPYTNKKKGSSNDDYGLIAVISSSIPPNHEPKTQQCVCK